MAEVDTCEHDWAWLTEVRYVIGREGQTLRGENVECSICGARTWAHGRMGNRPICIEYATPTTGRS